MANAILYILIGMSIGAVMIGIPVFIFAQRTQGTLHIDRSYPENPHAANGPTINETSGCKR